MSSTAYDGPEDCLTPVFPIFYGSDSDVTINHFGADKAGTGMIIAGQGTDKPFAPAGSSVAKGFIGYLDAYGQPHWIYYVDNEDLTSKTSNCFHASQSVSTLTGASAASVLGVCRVYNMEIKD